MNQELLQNIGYFASIVTASSMVMSSIVKFRWVNLVGATIFMTYGFLIGALPVGLLNAFIVGTDIYYLFKIYSRKEQFKTLEIKADNKYLLEFLAFHQNDMQAFFPGFSYKPEMNTVSFFVLRNMSVAGIFLAHREEGDVLKVGLDYVIPEYRDYKNGRYVYHRLAIFFEMAGYKKIVVESKSKKYEKYLQKMGFVKAENGFYEKLIQKTMISE